MVTVSREIFKVYDIRGIVGKTLTNEVIYLVGKAIITKTTVQNIDKITLGRDGRTSDPELTGHVQRGSTDSGIDVLNVGMAATPMLYYAAINECGDSGVMITGSHSPPDYNGLRMIFGGDTLAGPVIQELLVAIEADRFTQPATKGSVTEKDISVEYRNYIIGHVKLKHPMKIIIGTGNGVGGAFVGMFYCMLGNEVTELFSEVDGTFPHHHPDPFKPKNLQDLIATLKNSDTEIGLALDGNVDRLGVVTKDGNIIYPDHQPMLFSQDVLSRNSDAKAVFDAKFTRLLAPWIKEHSGEPIMEKTDHNFTKPTVKKTNALIADEASRHVLFKGHWFGFDDGMYADARLLETLFVFNNPIKVLDNLSQSISTSELNIDLPEGSSGHQVIGELAVEAKFEGVTEIIAIDGLRVEFPDGLGLVRASNTMSILVLRFEVDSDEAIGRIQDQFKAVVESNPALKWPL